MQHVAPAQPAAATAVHGCDAAPGGSPVLAAAKPSGRPPHARSAAAARTVGFVHADRATATARAPAEQQPRVEHVVHPQAQRFALAFQSAVDVPRQGFRRCDDARELLEEHCVAVPVARLGTAVLAHMLHE